MKIRIVLSAIVALAVSSAAFAQAYPGKPIRLISPWSPGGPAEGLARVVTTKMSEALGQPILIEAKPGANGTIATAFVAKAAPDGYIILLSHLGRPRSRLRCRRTCPTIRSRISSRSRRSWPGLRCSWCATACRCTA